MTQQFIRQRILLFQIVVLICFVILSIQLWRLQIIGGENYQTLSKENRITSEKIDAARGVIYDRKGRILVRNRPLFRATFLPAQILNETWPLWEEQEWNKAAATMALIANALEVPFPEENAGKVLEETFENVSGQMLIENIGKLCQEGKLLECFAEGLVTAPHHEITLQQNLPSERAFILMENSVNLPGVSIITESQREYLYGELYAHLLGYELPISQDRLQRQTRFTTNPYLASDRVGVAGIEAGFEDKLRGVRGLRRVEKNIVGRQIRVLHEEPGTPGHNLFMTIDSELQQVVTDALQDGLDEVESKEGVAIVMSPKTGEVLAMVSLPSYDNNVFVGDIDPEEFQTLFEDETKPIFNRAVSGTYPPGSIFKILPAAAGLAEGTITQYTEIFDPGKISIGPQDFVCWKDDGHGNQNVIEAIAHSCDIFFYEIVGGYLDRFRGLGVDALAKWSNSFGLGQLTYIDIPGEAVGQVPTRQWKRLRHQESWSIGDSYNMSIGQGFMLVTPLQILNATIAMVNGGTLYQPQIVYQVQDSTGEVVQSFEPKILHKIDMPQEIFDMVNEGMRSTISMDDGTAAWRFIESPVNVAGKTGTAEYCPVIQKDDGTYECLLSLDGYQLTHAWFTAYAPYEDPEIALVVFVHGNNRDVIQGSEVAAPIARRIIDYYFSEPLLDPIDPPRNVIAEDGNDNNTQAQEIFKSGNYNATMLYVGNQGSKVNFVLGEVVNKLGQPIADEIITIYADDKAIASVKTDENGKFRYDTLDHKKSERWVIRAPHLPGDPSLEIMLEVEQYYNMLFQENP